MSDFDFKPAFKTAMTTAIGIRKAIYFGQFYRGARLALLGFGLALHEAYNAMPEPEPAEWPNAEPDHVAHNARHGVIGREPTEVTLKPRTPLPGQPPAAKRLLAFEFLRTE